LICSLFHLSFPYAYKVKAIVLHCNGRVWATQGKKCPTQMEQGKFHLK
jgi:hypothetical protein